MSKVRKDRFVDDGDHLVIRGKDGKEIKPDKTESKDKTKSKKAQELLDSWFSRDR